MATQEKVGMPLDEFIRLSNDTPFELINGEMHPRLPTVGGHNYFIHLLYRLILAHLTPHQLGECFIEATYVLPERYDSNWVTGARIPNLLFYSSDRWDSYLAENPDWRNKPYLRVPDLVIEVVSPNDRVTELDSKIDAYLADGVRLIIVINPQSRKAIIYSPDADQPFHLSGNAQIDLSDVIPNLKIALPSLFA
jgi:Uma2 family endonuclease